jgi:hypothetical protein
MEPAIIDWFTNTLNFLIYIFIFIKTLGTACFNQFDLSVSLFGIGVSVLGFVVGLINKYNKGSF